MKKGMMLGAIVCWFGSGLAHGQVPSGLPAIQGVTADSGAAYKRIARNQDGSITRIAPSIAPTAISVYLAPQSRRVALSVEAGFLPNKRGGSVVAGVGGFQNIERAPKDAAGHWGEKRFWGLGPTLGYRQPFLRFGGGEGTLELSAAAGWAPLSWVKTGTKGYTGQWHFVYDNNGNVIDKAYVDSWIESESTFAPLTGYGAIGAVYRFKKTGLSVGVERRTYASLQTPKESFSTLGISVIAPLKH